MLNEVGAHRLPQHKINLPGSWRLHGRESKHLWLTQFIPSMILAEGHGEKLARKGERRGSDALHPSCFQTRCVFITQAPSSLIPAEKNL